MSGLARFRVACETCADDPDVEPPTALETRNATLAILAYGEHKHERGHDANIGVVT